MLTTDPRLAPDEPLRVRLGFAGGTPVSIDGRALAPVVLVERLNEVAGAHGVGRVDIVENRLVGMKSRGVYETPAGTLLLEALRSLRALTVERDTAELCEKLGLEWARRVYNGQWFHPAREALDAFFERAMASCTGEVTLELYKGTAKSVGTKSALSLYEPELASFTMGASFEPIHAEGFVRLFGLPGAVYSRVVRGVSQELVKEGL